MLLCCFVVRLDISGKWTMRANGKKRPSDRVVGTVVLDETGGTPRDRVMKCF